MNVYTKFFIPSFPCLAFFSGGFSLPDSANASTVSVNPAVSVIPSVLPVAVNGSSQSTGEAIAKVEAVPVAIETDNFMDYLLKKFRPRLSVSAFSPEFGFFGDIDFYDNGVLVERYPIATLHSLGVALIHREYGADLVYKGKAFIVTAWKLPDTPIVTASEDNIQVMASH